MSKYNSNSPFTGAPKRIHTSLPVFRYDWKGRSVIYTPGYMAILPINEADWLEEKYLYATQDEGDLKDFSGEVVALARRSREHWNTHINRPYMPECLTVYLSNTCNLACIYCWSEDVSPRKQNFIGKLSEKDVLWAAKKVAKNCRKKDKRFMFVVQGGGEAVTEWDVLQKIVAVTKTVAAEEGLEWWGYIATNGIFSMIQAKWLGETFNEVCLSCDGPPFIQNKQRPMANGLATSHVLEQTAAIIHSQGCRLSIRTTITQETVTFQEEIAEYLIETLAGKQIRFEPVYKVQGRGWFGKNEVERFVEFFIKARDKAQKKGVELKYSGVRMDELHSGYCNYLRDVLLLLPNGQISNCPFSLGEGGQKKDLHSLSQEMVYTLKRQAAFLPVYCHSCVNMYHCTRDCPDVCHLDQLENGSDTTGFRCAVNRLMTIKAFQAAVEKTIVQEGKDQEVISEVPRVKKQARGKNSRGNDIYKYLNEAPDEIDKEKILAGWRRVKDFFGDWHVRLPKPQWEKCGFSQDGPGAWETVLKKLGSRSVGKPISIYCHVPFCKGRCHFCDCHSIPLLSGSQSKEVLYTRKLHLEIEAWRETRVLSKEQVTTVHFGGGTPNCISDVLFESIVEKIGLAFNCNEATEWAVETTAEKLHAGKLLWLKSIGVQRLHVGVQTLDDDLRRQIGRKTLGKEVIKGIYRALEAGFIVSVDLIYGLPGQTIPSLIATIKKLLATGIHGFSLYQLQESRKNSHFVRRYADLRKDCLYEYILFQVADQLLFNNGYRKNHFAHYAKPEDKNLYYSHKARGEDLIALGPTSDGIIGDFQYKHMGIDMYLMGEDTKACPWLQGGVQESSIGQNILKLQEQLMTGTLERKLFADSGFAALFDQWGEQKMIEPADESGIYRLSANGSWFIAFLQDKLLNLP